MNRYRQYGQLDDSPEIVGDGGFTRLDMLTDPALLPQGTLAISENVRFGADGTTVRKGLARQFPAGTSVGKIYGVCNWKPTRDEDYLLAITARYLILFNYKLQTISYYVYPPGEKVEDTDTVDVVQAGVGSGTLPQAYILRGQSKTALQFDSNAGSVTVATGFAQGDVALFYGDRIAVGVGQSVYVSDFLAFTTFRLLNQFQILKGSDDYVVGFLAHQNDTVLIGTRQRWFIAYFSPVTVVGGYSGSISDTSTLRPLTNEAGPVGPKASIFALGNLWFLSSRGIYAFAPMLDGSLTVLGKPISTDIQPIMDRLCVRYAARACIEHDGYRLYVAMPISDVPVAITSASILSKVTTGLLLPFNLPALLSTDAVVTFTTGVAHNLAQNDAILISGAPSTGLNGEFAVMQILSPTVFTVAMNVGGLAASGNRMKVQKLATRNNCIAVYNLANQGFESIDWLPNGIAADWLRSVEHSAQRRLLVVDETIGPLLYEEADADEINAVTGSVTLPVNLPFNLTQANFASTSIGGHIVSRALRWTASYSNPGAGVYPRKILGCETRATLGTGDALTQNLIVRTPNNALWIGSRNFVAEQFDTPDVALRKLCGQRGLEAQIEIITTGGRPTVRSMVVSTVNNGKVEE